VVLLSRDDAYTTLRWFVAAPITTRVRRLPSTVLLDPAVDPVPRLSVITLDSLQVVSDEWLVDQIGQLSSDRIAEVDRALHFALGLRD
jgi:mRNA-degrading endonuclease toxin of MazEF toxin-antitoxin module